MILRQCIRGGNAEKQEGFILSFRYDADTVEKLKQAIPHTHREWYPEAKTWWVSVEYELQLEQLFSNFKALVYAQGRLW